MRPLQRRVNSSPVVHIPHAAQAAVIRVTAASSFFKASGQTTERQGVKLGGPVPTIGWVFGITNADHQC